ncbi:MAG TPA: hypothetical protein VMV29_19585 [Ktedonobacterales bacterium]|nr:hypothetical protein [Ktedonobacterales bacterium]
MNPSTPSAQVAAQAKAGAGAVGIDLVTVGSIAVVVYLISVFTHEALGHGVAALIVGAHVNQVTSVDLDASSVGGWSDRFVAAAGCLAQFILGGVSLAFYRTRPPRQANARYFVWLLAHLNIFIPAGYLMALSFASFGDWNAFVQGLPDAFFWRLGLTALGVALSFAAQFSAVQGLDPFLGREIHMRRRRGFALTLAPYLVGGVVNTLAGALNPVSPQLILISAAAASFGGAAFLGWMGFWVYGAREHTPETPLTPTRSMLWIGLGVIALLIYFLALGPGLPRASLL